MERASGRSLERLRDRVGAVLLLLVLWPILLLTLLVLLVTRKGRLTQREVVEIPAPDSPATWQIRTIVRFELVNPDRPKRLSRLQQILYEFIPGLFSVLEGNVFFVGARPRSRADVEALPPDWKSLYLKTKAGLITEADVMFGRDASEDELYTSEVFYSATESFRHDVKLLARWLWQTFAGAAEPAPDLMDHFRNS